MEDQTKKEIFDVITKNLPEHVGGALKQRLEQIETLENQNKLLNDKLLKRDKEIDLLRAEQDNLKKLNLKSEQLQQKENDLNQRELRLDLTVAEIRLQESEKRANEIAGYTGMVLKSPVFRRSINEHQTYTPYFNGQAQTMQPSGFNRMETEEIA